MKTLGIISFILLGAIAFGITFIGCGGRATGADGTVIAEFQWDGKHHITLEEMMQEISELPEYKQDDYKSKEGLEEYMSLMAESRLILCFAKDQKLDEDAEILKKVQDYLHELMVDRITELEVDEKLKVTEEDHRLYYESHKEDYVEHEEVRLTCITVTDEDRAKEVFQQIKDGRDIAELARELSDRGELNGPGANAEDPGATTLSHDSFPMDADPFVHAAFDLEVGQINDEIVSLEIQGQQYHMIFRKEEDIPARQKAFDEEDVRRSIEGSAEREKREQLMNDWIDRLYEQAKVKTHIDRIPEAPKDEEAPPEAEEASEGESDPADDSDEDESEEQ